MKTYLVSASVTISLRTVVEANTKEEAEEIASERALCSLASPEQMGESEETHWCHSGELDGLPDIKSVNET